MRYRNRLASLCWPSLLLATAAPVAGGDLAAQTLRPPERPRHKDYGVYALAGNDPVALCAGTTVAGRNQWSHKHGRYGYRFSSEDNFNRFARDPERYAIQFDGSCARMGPTSVQASPHRWLVFDQRIYAFASDACSKMFGAAPEGFLPPPPSGDKPSAAQLEAGDLWLQRAVAAHGGEQALRAMHGVDLVWYRRTTGTRNVFTTSVLSSGATVKSQVSVRPGAEDVASIWAIRGNDAFVTIGNKTDTLHNAHTFARMRRHAHRQPVAHLWAYLRGKANAVHLGPGQLGEVKTTRIEVTHDGLTTHLHLHPDTHRFVGMTWQGWFDDGHYRDVVEQFTRWQEVEGVSCAAARTFRVDGTQRDPDLQCYKEVRALKADPASLTRPK